MDVDLHLLRGEASTSSCVERNDREIERTLEPGTWFVVIDSYVAAGAEQGRTYRVAAVAESSSAGRNARRERDKISLAGYT